MKLSKDESRAIAFVVGLVALAAVARMIGRPHDTDLPRGGEVDAATLEAKSEAALQREKASARPLGNDERVEVNTASVDELDRLPGVGPGLAARILAERQRGGGFDSAPDLRAVPGLGRALLAKLEPHLSFGPAGDLARRDHGTALEAEQDSVGPEKGEQSARGRHRRSGRPVTPGSARPAEDASVLHSHTPALPHSAEADEGPTERLDLNRATAAELEALPGIGPALAARIVARRDSAAFRSVEELVKVRGIGPATLARLRQYFRS